MNESLVSEPVDKVLAPSSSTQKPVSNMLDKFKFATTKPKTVTEVDNDVEMMETVSPAKVIDKENVVNDGNVDIKGKALLHPRDSNIIL